MRIVFFGTSPLAVTIIDALVNTLTDNGIEIIAVFTKPDRRTGRGQRLLANPVKVAAQERALPLLQPESWNQIDRDALTRLQTDLGVVVAYGMVLPESVIETPRLGCINLHTSKLPRWRGAAPIARAIEAGDTITGVSLMKLVPELDAGPIIDHRDCPIEAHDTTASMSLKLARLGSEMLCSSIRHPPRTGERMLADAVPQRRIGVCHAPKLSKAEAEIDWRQAAMTIDRKVRALNPWPIAQAHTRNLMIRIWESRTHPAPSKNKPPGHIDVINRRLFVHCGQGLLEIRKLQTPGGEILTSQDFLNGHTLDDAAFNTGRSQEPGLQQ